MTTCVSNCRGRERLRFENKDGFKEGLNGVIKP